VISAWNYNPLYAILAASGVILTAGYILWAVQRVYLGAEYKGPHAEGITPITDREVFIAGALLTLCIVLGVYPELIFSQMRASVNLFVESVSTAKGLPDAIAHMTGL
jgi:NADH-quinone oxidoreductase subunit M